MTHSTLNISEIFYSLQGESLFIGKPCIFIRLAECHLRCTYCDTAHAYLPGQPYSIAEILTEISKYACRLVEITGGEPLLQEPVYDLLTELIQKGFQVLLETSGTLDISKVPRDVSVIMDLKGPSSGMSIHNRFENIILLKPQDQIKFVILNRPDYEWAKEVMMKYHLPEKCHILISTLFDPKNYQQVAEWILADALPVTFQPQLHKVIWGKQSKSK